MEDNTTCSSPGYVQRRHPEAHAGPLAPFPLLHLFFRHLLPPAHTVEAGETGGVPGPARSRSPLGPPHLALQAAQPSAAPRHQRLFVAATALPFLVAGPAPRPFPGSPPGGGPAPRAAARPNALPIGARRRPDARGGAGTAAAWGVRTCVILRVFLCRRGFSLECVWAGANR